MSRISRDHTCSLSYVSHVARDYSFRVHIQLFFNMKMTDKFDEKTQVLHTLLPKAFSLIIFQKELAEFLETQQAQVRTQAYRSFITVNSISKARMSSQILTFTVQCWDKCVTGTPSTRFSRSEETCLANCVDRFLDTSLFMVKQIGEKRNESGR
jgi:mitochondrial import inner membrane translocase subunit TIM8